MANPIGEMFYSRYGLMSGKYTLSFSFTGFLHRIPNKKCSLFIVKREQLTCKIDTAVMPVQYGAVICHYSTWPADIV